MVDGGLLVIARLVVDDTQVDMGEELACNISHFLVTCMIVNRVTVELRITLTQLHVVNTDAVISQSLTVHITDSLANLEELFVLFDSEFELSEIIIEDTSRVVGTALIS